MKKILLLVLVVLLFSGCTKTISDTELYGDWITQTTTEEQNLNNIVVTKKVYELKLNKDKTYEEVVSVTSKKAASIKDSAVTNTYTIKGTYTITKGEGITLKANDFHSTNDLENVLPEEYRKPTYYFTVNAGKLNLCFDSLCDKVFIKNEN